MWKFGFLLWTFMVFQVGFGEASGERHNATAEERAFSVLTVLTFQNTPCVSSSSQTGVCYKSDECSSRGGRSDGNCASGFGVCCVFVVSTCGSTITQNCTHIQNSDFPASQASIGTSVMSCLFNVNTNADICQLRLDIINMDIQQPDVLSYQCSDWMLPRSSTGKLLTRLCGRNDGQHVYVETGRSSPQVIDFSFNQLTTSVNAVTRIYNVKVSQIPCDANYRAPTDCYQYFTETAGTFETFNFASQLLHFNQAYSTCFRKPAGLCTMQLSQAKESAGIDTFQLSTIFAETTVMNTKACKQHYITVPGLTPTQNPGRYCGGVLGSTVGSATSELLTTTTMPFTVNNQFANNEGLPNKAVGYRINYSFSGC